MKKILIFLMVGYGMPVFADQLTKRLSRMVQVVRELQKFRSRAPMPPMPQSGAQLVKPVQPPTTRLHQPIIGRTIAERARKHQEIIASANRTKRKQQDIVFLQWILEKANPQQSDFLINQWNFGQLWKDQYEDEDPIKLIFNKIIEKYPAEFDAIMETIALLDQQSELQPATAKSSQPPVGSQASRSFEIKNVLVPGEFQFDRFVIPANEQNVAEINMSWKNILNEQGFLCGYQALYFVKKLLNVVQNPSDPTQNDGLKQALFDFTQLRKSMKEDIVHIYNSRKSAIDRNPRLKEDMYLFNPDRQTVQVGWLQGNEIENLLQRAEINNVIVLDDLQGLIAIPGFIENSKVQAFKDSQGFATLGIVLTDAQSGHWVAYVAVKQNNKITLYRLNHESAIEAESFPQSEKLLIDLLKS